MFSHIIGEALKDKFQGEYFLFIIDARTNDYHKVNEFSREALKNDEYHKLIIDPIVATPHKLGPKVNNLVQVYYNTFIFLLMWLQ